MTEKQEASVKCPFYMRSWKNTLECESFIGSTAMLTRFGSVKALLEHVKTFCAQEDGGACPLAMNLYDKYARLEQIERERNLARQAMGLKKQ